LYFVYKKMNKNCWKIKKIVEILVEVCRKLREMTKFVVKLMGM
jgi:hypothetical protein